ncbi:RidA family protein [Denitrobaculum tricleocarpae]|uniref:RidA family protein n=1 Tax=Denitrobaculum tricleocarpae TaxID=2591009 RepID=A0A545TKP4_9PROT|nr:RidA family protein [Denitrobaculum tricleocarpae]
MVTEIIRLPGTAPGRCRAVVRGDFVWTVGTGAGKTVAEQTRNTLAAIETNLKDAGTDKHRILEATVYLTDMATKAEMDEVWCAWIPEDGWPCRACVGTNLAPGDLVEIKLLAAK